MTRDPHLTAPIPAPEGAAVGCALWADVARAAEIVGCLQEEDIASPAVRLVHRVVTSLCTAGIAPDPAAVLAHAVAREYVVGETAIRSLTRTLWELYDHRVTIPAAWPLYAAAALEQSWRRRTLEMATRLAQVADHADPAELDRLTHAEQAAVDAIRARHRAITSRAAVAA